MPLTPITMDPDVASLLREAEGMKEEVLRGWRSYSDVRDEEGHQYVDLVQQGGGVLGIALVGYTMVLEKAGIRFHNIAGTSAGGINAMMLAASGRPNEERSPAVLKALEEKELSELVDGPKPIPSIIDTWVKGKSLWSLNWKHIIFRPAKSFKAFFGGVRDRFGVNPGENFHRWMKEELGEVNSLPALRERMAVDGLGLRCNGQPFEEAPRLCLIATELQTKSKVELPLMAHLFYEDPENAHPADFVRATMSVPLFFEPFDIHGIPKAGQKDPEWEDLLLHRGEVPERVRFVDGGMLSNFPIDVFHRRDLEVPRKPTFGARLSSFREELDEVENLSDYAGSLLHIMRHDFDVQYLAEHEELQELICTIEAGERVDWLNFYLSPEEEKLLFRLGAERALEFLKGFNWEEYKEERRKG